MKINYSFFIRVNENGERKPEMTFFPIEFNMLSHIGELDFSKSINVSRVIDEIEHSVLNSKKYSFASDDWCILNVDNKVVSIVNGFDEFKPFELPTDFIIKLLTDWRTFLIKYEYGKIPGLIY